MPRDNYSGPVPRAPAAISGDDLLKQLARLLGRAAARQWVARERRSAPAAERQSEEKLDD
jgi:hypothetical protein